MNDDALDDEEAAGLTDQHLQMLWQEGIASGDADQLDFALLKAEARERA